MLGEEHKLSSSTFIERAATSLVQAAARPIGSVVRKIAADNFGGNPQSERYRQIRRGDIIPKKNSIPSGYRLIRAADMPKKQTKKAEKKSEAKMVKAVKAAVKTVRRSVGQKSRSQKSAASRAVPVAYSMARRVRPTTTSMSGDTMTLKGTEYIGPLTITSSQKAGDVLLDFMIAAGNTVFTQLQIYRNMYQRFVFEQVAIHFDSFVATSTNGGVTGYFDADVDDVDPTGEAALQVAALSKGATKTNLWRSNTWNWDLSGTKKFEYYLHEVPLNKNFAVIPGNATDPPGTILGVAGDKRLERQGHFVLLYEGGGQASTFDAGNLFVEYKIRLLHKLVHPAVPAAACHYVSTAESGAEVYGIWDSATTCYGAPLAIPGNSGGLAYNVYFLRPGYFVLSAFTHSSQLSETNTSAEYVTYTSTASKGSVPTWLDIGSNDSTMPANKTSSGTAYIVARAIVKIFVNSIPNSGSALGSYPYMTITHSGVTVANVLSRQTQLTITAVSPEFAQAKGLTLLALRSKTKDCDPKLEPPMLVRAGEMKGERIPSLSSAVRSDGYVRVTAESITPPSTPAKRSASVKR